MEQIGEAREAIVNEVFSQHFVAKKGDQDRERRDGRSSE
jgi:hypothetical protein